jgi:superfamily II DNA or RNA helicase
MSGSSILIFVRRVRHGEILRQLIQDSIFVHGGTSTVERLEATKETNKVVISTSIFEEGINAPQFDVIINAAGGKAAIPTSQRVGRGMRLSAGKKLRVFDFYDAENSMLQRHSYARSKVYKNLGFEVKKHTLS